MFYLFCSWRKTTHFERKSDFDLPLKDDCTDSIYLNIKTLLPKLYDKVKPDFIFYLCGVDVLKTDRLGRLV